MSKNCCLSLGKYPPTPPLTQRLHLRLTWGKMLGQGRGRWAVCQKPKLIQNIKLSYIAQIRLRCWKGVFTWHRGDFRSGASSLWFPLMALYLFTWYHHKFHAGASHPGASSPRFLYRSENFTPVRNLPTVSCKPETTTRFGVKLVCR